MDKAPPHTQFASVGSGVFAVTCERGAAHAVAPDCTPLVAGEHTASTRPAYWHGGAPGLKVGEYILPPSVTGTAHTLSAYADCLEPRPGYLPTRVYVTPEYEAAEVFAAMYPDGGWVYRVEPEGVLEADLGSTEPGLSFACERARIVEVRPLKPARVEAILSAILAGDDPEDIRGAAQDLRAQRQSLCECGCAPSRHNNGSSGCTDCGYVRCPAFRTVETKGGEA